ncbi:MAG: thioesterase [Flavobacteriaceae bacterium]|nr:thioesterase [Flavobacteriaceae bacterium]|tara:strand:- start:16989 stop:17444 length:456 start_codon:yes stop_codon:yes gene_type:complete
MTITPGKINRFMLFKLPLAFFGGVRVQSLSKEEATVIIRHRWINQNPFRSLFWAAQGMAAEMSTGVLVIQSIQNSGKNVSMLVTHQEGSFFKKATGKIRFHCAEGEAVDAAIEKSISSGEGQKIIMTSVGNNQDGVEVCRFKFEWSLKVKA